MISAVGVEISSMGTSEPTHRLTLLFLLSLALWNGGPQCRLRDHNLVKNGFLSIKFLGGKYERPHKTASISEHTVSCGKLKFRDIKKSVSGKKRNNTIKYNSLPLLLKRYVGNYNKAALPQHMDNSIVFTWLRQCDPV